jgi:hypothetical protein
MMIAALTGISPEVIRELKSGKSRTLELQSTHNVVTLARVEPGTMVFMTSVDMEDLLAGDPGIIVEVELISISMKRIVEFALGMHFEERERMSARIKVRYIAPSTVRSAKKEEITQPTVVDVIKSSCYHAG